MFQLLERLYALFLGCFLVLERILDAWIVCNAWLAELIRAPVSYYMYDHILGVELLFLLR
jgi:hypothetical protein